MKTVHKKQSGFTIVELMIATLVFSTILLICSAGIVRIGRIYLNGVVNSRTQEATRNALDVISQTIQYAPEGFASSVSGDGQINAVCFDGQQFTYALDRKVVTTAPTDTSKELLHALVTHPVAGGGCAAPNIGTFNSDTYQGLELISPNMQLLDLNIDETLGSGKVRITIKIAHGDDDLRDASGFCKLEAGSEFCSVVELSTIVQKRIQ